MPKPLIFFGTHRRIKILVGTLQRSDLSVFESGCIHPKLLYKFRTF